MEIKAGWKTTEFWVTVATVLGGLFSVVPLPGWGYIALPGLYGIARSLAKAGFLKGTVGSVLNRL
jgi:hypothetical protein